MNGMSAMGTPGGSVAAPGRSVSVVIVGGGAAGITVAAQLRKRRRHLRIVVIEPSDTHSYQPGWTLVGAGVFTHAPTERREASVMPKGITWVKQAVRSFHPELNQVELADGSVVGYDYLVVCPGLQLDWNKIEGLSEALGRDGVCINYSARYAGYTWECIQAFGGGTALFAQPPMPIKCAGAPQKIMYLAADRFRKTGRLSGADIEFNLAGDVLFGVPAFVPPLQEAADCYGIKLKFKHTLKAVDGPAKKAVFSITARDGALTELVRPFDMIHVTPPQSAPDFIKASPLANEGGWIAVDPATVRHTRFASVFGLGDAAGTTNAKTAAGVRFQAPVVVDGVLAAVGGKVTPRFPLDPRVPRTSAWLLKTKLLPFMYWQLMLRGNTFDIKHRERPLAVAG